MSFQCILFLFSLRCLSLATSQEQRTGSEDPELYYNMVELVCSEGYHIQEHIITTDDNYLLNVYRIPGGKRRPKVPKRSNHYLHVHNKHHQDFQNCFIDSMNVTFRGPPVLMSHGLAAASDCWVLQGDGKDLAYMLTEQGYDVWFTNIRGNFYSKRHKTLKPTQKAFWDFSFHENGIYDMVSTIDYVLNFTGFQKLHYVGHSMGTTMFFVMTSVKPEYNEKINLFVGLTPVAQVRRQSYTPAKKAILEFLILLVQAYIKNGVYQFLPRNGSGSYLTRMACTTASPTWLQNLCYDASFFFAGYRSKLMTREKLPVYLTHGFSGSSVKTYIHYAQFLDASNFQFFDYGPEENFRRYAQAEPPIYDLRKITAPVALFYSQGDYISDYKDVNHLKTFLPNVIESQEYSIFSHVDFIWAYNAKSKIYNEILDLMNKYLNR